MPYRRLAVPLALSVLGHGLLVLVVSLLPAEAPPPRPSGALKAQKLTLSLEDPRQKAAPAVKEEWVDVNVGTGSLVLPPGGASASAEGPDQAPTLSGTSGGPFAAPGGNASGAGSGGPAKGSQVVVVPASVRRVVYLLDRSVSMGLSDALDRGRVELAASLRALAPDTLFQVFVYNRTARPMVLSRGLLPATPDNVARVLRELDAVSPGGDTCHVEAIRAALALRPELLILLSDADDLSARDVQLVSQANQGRTLIDTVELTRDRRGGADAGLALLARLNGGTHRRVVLGR